MTWTFRFLKAVQLAVHDVKNPAPKVYPIQCLIQGEARREMESGAMINVYQSTGDEFLDELCAVFYFQILLDGCFCFGKVSRL